jgi:hypothetical protein
MKLIVKFYAAILAYIQMDAEFEEQAKGLVEQAKEAKASWETTLESLALLVKACNHGSQFTKEEDHVESDTKAEFTLAAFRDLSVLRVPEAMELFARLDQEVNCGIGDDYVWAKSVKARPDGSAVILLHVSNLEGFKDMVEKCGSASIATSAYYGTLQEGVVLGH